MVFETINQVAKRGILTEFRLRQMKKQGKLPGIYAGTRYYVNVDALLGMLSDECDKNSGVKE